MTKILITGSAGFLGSNLIRFLLYNDKDIKIAGLDKLCKYSALNNVYINKSTEFFMANICDVDILKRIFKLNNPDYVIHLASIDLYSLNLNDNLEMIDNNLKGLYNIIEMCKEFGSKLIYISSSDVYNGTQIKKTETTATFAKNTSIAYKICCENLIQLNDVKYNIIRIPEAFGPRQHTGVVANMFLDVKGHEKISLYNKGNIIRDLLHVEDFSSGILTLLKNWKDNEIYNISSNVDFTELEIASMIIETLQEGKIEFLDQEIEIKSIELDCSKIRELKWKPSKKFKIRIQDTILWYNQNKFFFK